MTPGAGEDAVRARFLELELELELEARRGPWSGVCSCGHDILTECDIALGAAAVAVVVSVFAMCFRRRIE